MSRGTVYVYRLELAVALDGLGAETPARDLTPEAVVRFFASDRVTKTRAGGEGSRHHCEDAEAAAAGA